VSTEGGSYVIHIHKPDAWLAYDEGVGWRRRYPVRDVGLEIDDTGGGKVEVVSPPSHNRIRLDSYMPTFLEKREKNFPHLPKTVTSASRRVVDKSQGCAPLGS